MYSGRLDGPGKKNQVHVSLVVDTLRVSHPCQNSGLQTQAAKFQGFGVLLFLLSRSCLSLPPRESFFTTVRDTERERERNNKTQWLGATGEESLNNERRRR